MPFPGDSVYVKLFASILKSSVWDESPTTRIVWITMLIEADEFGMVKGVESGLMRTANVTSVADFRAAMAVLEAPDINSQDPEFAGRRIERVEGGWLVLNYTKYRQYRTRAQVKDAEKKRRQRAKPKPDNGIATNGDSPYADVPGHVPLVPTIASASSSELRSTGDVENRERGDWTTWCQECGGRKEIIGGQPHLRHLDWCGRRT